MRKERIETAEKEEMERRCYILISSLWPFLEVSVEEP